MGGDGGPDLMMAVRRSWHGPWSYQRMYLDFFGLQRRPFRNTPDTGLFFSGCQRGAILEGLCYAIQHGEGIVKVVGEVGTGKTTLCRMLEQALPPSVYLVYLANPNLRPHDMLRAVAAECGIAVTALGNAFDILQALQTRLLALHGEGKQVVVLIEEAQSMPLDSLEEIRLLSNLETSQEKLLQLVLFGQPELDRNLRDRRIRQLTERIAHSFHLPPCSGTDIRDYVNFRLCAAGYPHHDLFTAAALKEIARYSRGLLRRVNVLADKAMLAAYRDHSFTVTGRHVRQAVRDCEFSRGAATGLWWAGTAAGAVAGVVLAMLGAGGSGAGHPAVSAGRFAAAEFAAGPERAFAASSRSAEPTSRPEALRSLLDATTRQVGRRGEASYTVQLLTVFERSAEDVLRLERFIARQRREGLNDLLLFHGRIADRPAWVLSYRLVGSYDDAKDVLAGLPRKLRHNSPLIRTVRSLRRELAGT